MAFYPHNHFLLDSSIVFFEKQNLIDLIYKIQIVHRIIRFYVLL